MTNTTISISIPTNVYAWLKIMADKDMRSARNYIAKLLIEHVPDELRSDNEDIKPEIKAYFDKNKSSNASDLMKCIDCGIPTFSSNEAMTNAKGKCNKCK